MAIDNFAAISSVLNSYFKKAGLESEYNTTPNRLTADNINAIISGILQLSETDVQLNTNLLNKFDEIATIKSDLLSLLQSISGDLQSQISSINKAIEESSSSVIFAQRTASAAFAVSANIAGSSLQTEIAKQATIADKVPGTISFKTNEVTNVSYNGADNLQIESILSSTYANNAIDATSAKYAQRATTADSTPSALHADAATMVYKPCIYLTAEEEYLEYDGSTNIILSSIFKALSADYSGFAEEAISAEYDNYGHFLNTEVEYIGLEDNFDYPALCSFKKIQDVESNEKYKAGYSENILINPYLGAVKANYFIGTAVSATYAMYDEKKQLLNTRVCQNETENNYKYPILLGFIDTDTNPKDGENNEVLYTSQMRVNPYTNTIYATTDINEIGGGDYGLVSEGTRGAQVKFDDEHAIPVDPYIGQEINFVGLATRAIGDSIGYKNNTRVAQFAADGTNAADVIPLLACPSAVSTDAELDSQTVRYISNLTYTRSSNTLTGINTSFTNGVYNGTFIVVGNTGLSSTLSVKNNAYFLADCTIKQNVTLNSNANNTTTINGVLSAKANVTLNTSQSESTTINGSLTANNNVTLNNAAGESTTVNGTFKANYNVILNNAATETTIINGITTFNGSSTLNGSTKIKNTLTVTDKITGNNGLEITAGLTTLSAGLTVTGSTTLNSGVTISNGLTAKGDIYLNSSVFYATDKISLGVAGQAITAWGPTTISNTLTVTGSTSLTSVTVSSTASITGNLSVSGNVTLNDAATDTTTINGATTCTYTLTVEKETDLKSTLTVAGLTTLNKGLTVNTEITTLNAGLTVSGGATIRNGTTIYDDLTVQCKSTFNADINASGKTVTAETFDGTATKAKWADLAEIYETDQKYKFGTLVQLGGDKEFTIATTEVNGVISETPAYLMNSHMQGQPIALAGRVKILVTGQVHKFDYISLSDIPGIGIASKQKPLNYIGRALENNADTDIKHVLCITKFEL